MMKLLAIETSTHCASIALQTHQKTEQILIEDVKEHAKVLLPEIDRLLKRHSLSIKELDGIAFGRGPGSFTGLRVACSMAKGLAMAYDKPLYPISTLKAIAYEAQKGHESPILALIDARMSELYWSYHEKDKASFESVSQVFDIVPPGEGLLVIAGLGYEDYRSKFNPLLNQRVSLELSIAPKASTFIEMVNQGLISPENALNAEPIYVRNQITQGAPRG